MSASPLSNEQLLKLMEIPAWPGVFVLGSFARNVTIYSQQVRALNLIHALHKTGRIAQERPVAIIGGGAAGLTAAAAAATLGIPATLLEKASSPMPLQRQCQKRYLHPHIYDWPAPGSETKSAGLPVLDWTADYADEIVARHIEPNWRGLVDNPAIPLHPHFHITKVWLSPHPESPLKVHWKEPGQSAAQADFPVVIFALGFGAERETTSQFKYWDDTAFESMSGATWLVSGIGDSGLTDLMRVCIDRFRHHEIVELFNTEKNIDSIRAELNLIAAAQNGLNPTELAARFGKISAPVFERELRESKLLRDDRNVVLNGGVSFCEPKGSILNRFIVSQLDKAGAFTYEPHNIALDPKAQGSVRYEDGRRDQFDRVILRHGPDPERAHPLQEFPQIWKDCGALKKLWKEQQQDRTHIPLWTATDFDRSVAVAPVAPRSGLPELSNDGCLRCLVLASSGVSLGATETKLQTIIRLALDNRKAEIKAAAGFRQIEINPIVVSIDQALASRLDYEAMIRLCCEAPLLVVDVTGYEPGVMFLLGVRSVVRRGVSVAVTAQPLAPHQWAELPFNLKEINPLPYAGDDYARITLPITDAIANGFLQLNSIPHYSDLPAFEPIRRLGPAPNDSRLIPWTELVFVLCPFSKDYEARNWKQFLEAELLPIFPDFEGKRVVRRVLEIASPRLVSQRLYEALRRSVLCLVDWTEWRPSVFYEFGVRAAASPGRIFSLLDSADSTGKSDALHVQCEHLRALFAPIVYELGGGPGQLREIRNLVDATSGDPAPSSALPPGFTYNIVRDTISIENLPIKPVQRELREAVDTLIGADPRQAGVLPYLFSDAPGAKKLVRDAVTERLLAAWYYLRDRYHADTLPEGDALREEFVTLSETISNNSDQGHPAVAEVETTLKMIETLKKVADLKTKAQRKIKQNDFAGAIGDYEAAIELLLEAHGEIRVPGPASELERQVAKELADCYGSKGGAQRKNGELALSTQAYDQGYAYESDRRYGIVDSYNLVNRLLARVLEKPAQADALRAEFEQAAQTIQIQLDGPRKGDFWAMADLVTTRLMAGLDADSALASFKATEPPDYAKDALVKTLHLLLGAGLPQHATLESAVAGLHAKPA